MTEKQKKRMDWYANEYGRDCKVYPDMYPREDFYAGYASAMAECAPLVEALKGLIGNVYDYAHWPAEQIDEHTKEARQALRAFEGDE